MGRMLNGAWTQRLNIADGIAEWHIALDQQLSGDQTGTTRSALAMDGDGVPFGQPLRGEDQLAIELCQGKYRIRVVLHGEKSSDGALIDTFHEFFRRLFALGI